MSHGVDIPPPNLAAGSKKGRPSYLEILCQTKNIDELDTRIRINLQESLIRFIKDEKKWTSLPFCEQNKLLQKLTTRGDQNNLFAEKITVKCQDEKGNIIVRQANLLLDTTRNKNLLEIFDQVVNQNTALVFQEQFCFGLVEHIDRLIALESRLISIDESHPESIMLPISYVDVQDDFMPLSARDLELIRDNGLGIMIQLVPKFMRLPLNKLYYAVVQKNKDFPSLALQFYLDSYFSTRVNRTEEVKEREELIRTLFTKAFYTVVRMGGLKMEHLTMPETTRDGRFLYLTNDDDDSNQLLDSNNSSPRRSTFAGLIANLEKIRDKENQLRQRREIMGPAVKTELTMEKVLEDIFQICRDECQFDNPDEVTYLSRTAWLPTKIKTLSEWEQEILENHLLNVTHPDYLKYTSPPEQALFERWSLIATTEYENEKTLSQLQALGNVSEEIFKQELKLRLADRHKEIVEQNKEFVIGQVIKQISRMLRMGSLTAAMVVRERYDSFHQEVLPYIYFFSMVNAKQEQVWIPSPYPFSKLIHLIQTVDCTNKADGSPMADTATLALAKALLEQLLLYEVAKLEKMQAAGV
jgi:hypothetical protein